MLASVEPFSDECDSRTVGHDAPGSNIAGVDSTGAGDGGARRGERHPRPQGGVDGQRSHKGYSLPMAAVYHAWCGESGKRGGSPILPRRAHELNPTPEMGVSGVVSRRIWARIQLQSKTFFYKKFFGKNF